MREDEPEPRLGGEGGPNTTDSVRSVSHNRLRGKSAYQAGRCQQETFAEPPHNRSSRRPVSVVDRIEPR
jgi:hypothetical protein